MSLMFFDDSDRGVRRLPIYLLIDISASMTGARIEAVNQGIQLLYHELLESPNAIETVWISLITFGTTAETVVPLTALTDFSPPMLTPRGSTSLGAALQLVIDPLDMEIRTKTTEDARGDYRPIVFILTDGEPTDDWEDTAYYLRSHPYHPANIIVLGCGEEIQLEQIKQVGDAVLLMNEISTERVASFLPMGFSFGQYRQ